MKKIEFLVGTFLLGAGIGICNQASWGMDPFDVMTTGFSTLLQINLSIINLSIYLLMCLSTFYLDRKQLSLFTCIAPFVTSFGIEVVMRNIPLMSPNGVALLLYLIGVLMIALGTAIAVEAEVGKSPYDAFIFGLMSRTKNSYARIRWCVDGCCLVIGILSGGVWGMGTVISLLVIGKLIEKFQKLIWRMRLREERGMMQWVHHIMEQRKAILQKRF